MSYLFNPYWWKYFWRADTLYQVHSPFLFDFGTHVWPTIPTITNNQNPVLTFKNDNLHSWLTTVCTYYRTDKLMLPHDSGLINLFDKKLLASGLHTDDEFNHFSWHQILESKESRTTSYTKPAFSTLGIVSAGQISEKVTTALAATSDSFLLICIDIHQKKANYQSWNHIITTGEFNFSVELYNFGFLFCYPVNHKPEHITLIPWRYKPWKIKTI